MSPLDATNASFIMGLIVFVLLCTESQYGKGCNISISRLGIRPITTHLISGQSEHASLLRTMSFVKIDAYPITQISFTHFQTSRVAQEILSKG